MINRIVTTPNIPIHGIEHNSNNIAAVDKRSTPRELDALRQNSFIQIFQEKLLPEEVSFSAHALTRLEQRNIVVDEQIKAQLGSAIDKIAQKGGKESLIMLDDIAYLVSIPNKKVITALEASDSNVFTNIDSALLL